MAVLAALSTWPALWVPWDHSSTVSPVGGSGGEGRGEGGMRVRTFRRLLRVRDILFPLGEAREAAQASGDQENSSQCTHVPWFLVTLGDSWLCDLGQVTLQL